MFPFPDPAGSLGYIEMGWKCTGVVVLLVWLSGDGFVR